MTDTHRDVAERMADETYERHAEAHRPFALNAVEEMQRRGWRGPNDDPEGNDLSEGADVVQDAITDALVRSRPAASEPTTELRERLAEVLFTEFQLGFDHARADIAAVRPTWEEVEDRDHWLQRADEMLADLSTGQHEGDVLVCRVCEPDSIGLCIDCFEKNLLSRQDGEREADAWASEKAVRILRMCSQGYVLSVYRNRDEAHPVPVYFGTPPAPEAPEVDPHIYRCYSCGAVYAKAFEAVDCCGTGAIVVGAAGERPTLTQDESLALADIIWWIKGRLDAGEYRPFGEDHIEALRKARLASRSEETG